MRDLLAQASVLPEASGTSYEKTRTSHGKLEDVEPTMAGDPTFHRMASEFQACVTERDARLAIAKAEQDIERAKRTPQPENGMAEVGSLAWKREIAGVAEKADGGGDIKRIAAQYSVSRATVYNYLKRYAA